MANPMQKASPFRTICEVIREINDLHQEATPHDEEVRAKCAEAVDMGKRMDRALREIHGHTLADDGWWKPNPNFKRKSKSRRRMK